MQERVAQRGQNGLNLPAVLVGLGPRKKAEHRRKYVPLSRVLSGALLVFVH